MIDKNWLRATLAGAVCLLAGCASTYDEALVRQRSDWLYGAAGEAAVVGEGDARVARGGVNLGVASDERSRLERRLGDRDLSGYIQIGLEGSARLRAAYEEWLASTQIVAQASSLPEPRFTYVEFVEEIQTRTGPQERKFGLAQAFPWPGERGARGKLAGQKAEAMWARVEGARVQVVRDIEVAYFNYGFLHRELRIRSELLQLLRGLEPVVQSRIRAGAGQENILRLQVEIGRLEDDVASMERRRPALSARLTEAMNVREGELVLPWPELTEPELLTVDVASARADAMANNPALRIRSQELLASRAAQEVTQFLGKPGITLGLEYFDTSEARNSAAPGSGDDPVALSLSLSLPVQRSRYSSARREARHRMLAARQRLDAELMQVRTRVEEEAARVDDAGRRIILYRDSLLPRADESLRLTLAAYRTGSAALLDLIDSERATLEFQLSYWRACREFWIGDARLRALIGVEVSR